MPSIHDRHASEIDPVTLYRILRLRSEVFVVEQECAYLDLDGRDLEPGARLLWIDDVKGEVVATARVLVEGSRGGHRLGRVATARSHRGSRRAASLVEHVLATYLGPWHLDAQSHLVDWYSGYGFVAVGDEFLDDGIAHVPMARPAGGG